MKLRVGTRQSPLALWQAQHWIQRLQHIYPHIPCELVPLTTLGDRTKGALCEAGGKGLFSKEIHDAMIRGDINCAVHSLKDVETVPDAPSPWQSSFVDERIHIAAVWRAGSSSDVLISQQDPCHLVASDSKRRRDQLNILMPGVQFVGARGNITTRLKLVSGAVDGTILALAGLERLGLWKHGNRLEKPFDYLKIQPLLGMVPSAGQGVLAVDALDKDIQNIVATTNDVTCWQYKWVERRILQLLRANCHTSIGLEANTDGVRWYYRSQFGVHPHAEQPDTTAQRLAEHLLTL